MDMNQAFPSKYVKASDLNGKACTVTIIRVEMAQFEDGGESKPAAYFHGTAKGLILNKTNTNTIIDMYGPNSDSWIGQPITLRPSVTDFQGRQVACIRVQPNPPHQPAAPDETSQVAPPAPAPAPTPEPAWATTDPDPQQVPSDDIPF